MEKALIKTGFCIAYDWHLLQYALPLVYADSDVIYLSLDKDRISWAQNKFEFDEPSFKSFISDIDVNHKIHVYEDDFHCADLTPMENEVRQRNLLGKKMGDGGWHVQLDCDEYFLNFSAFVKYLHGIKPSTQPFNVCCSWITLFKQSDAGFFYIVPGDVRDIEYIQIATQTPVYTFGRRNDYFNIYTNFKILHQSWARPSSEIRQKIYNWGHRSDFNSDKYFEIWDKISEQNYESLRDFHPIHPPLWSKLQMTKYVTVPELVSKFDERSFITASALSLYFKNSRFFSKLRKLKSLIFR